MSMRIMSNAIRPLLACYAVSVCCVSPAVSLASSAPQAGDFHVGNSLTVDAGVLPRGDFDSLLESAGVERAETGWQVASGTPLRCHATFTDKMGGPLTPNTNPTFGPWLEAFALHRWRAVTFQPFTISSTAAQEKDAIVFMLRALRANPGNESTRVFLYPGFPATPNERYPVISATSFAEVWNAPMPDAAGCAPWPRTAAGVAWIVHEVQNETGERLAVVPTGEVLSELDRRLRERPVAGFTSAWDLYRDALHLGPRRGGDNPDSSGNYVAALTMSAALYGIDPGQTQLVGRWSGIDADFASLVRDVVSSVIRRTDAH